MAYEPVMGDKVLIKVGTRHYGRSSNNPADVVGTVYAVGRTRISVNWGDSPNGVRLVNSYLSRDLELAFDTPLQHKDLTKVKL